MRPAFSVPIGSRSRVSSSVWFAGTESFLGKILLWDWLRSTWPFPSRRCFGLKRFCAGPRPDLAAFSDGAYFDSLRAEADRHRAAFLQFFTIQDEECPACRGRLKSCDNHRGATAIFFECREILDERDPSSACSRNHAASGVASCLLPEAPIIGTSCVPIGVQPLFGDEIGGAPD